MTIKVLHIFAPSLKNRFSGDSIWWKNTFTLWHTVDVMHLVLDYENARLVESRKAFDFAYSDAQKSTSRGERAAWIFTLFRNLIKQDGNYDILHVHVLWWGTLIIGPWAKWKKIPTVYESVLLDADTPGGILKERLGKIKIRFLKSYRAILAISEYLAGDYLKQGFSDEQVFTLLHCVDLELFSPATSKEEKTSFRQKLHLPVDATILVFVGSVIERKGVDVLVRAFIQARSEHPDLFLLVVGPKDKNENPSVNEDFVSGLYALIDQEQISGRVSFMGLIQDRQKLTDIYRASDMFVFPSHQEGLPNVVLEAMATGLPVVTSQLPVLEKIIQNGENGLVAPIGDVEGTSAAILRLCGDPALAGRLGSNARSSVEEKHGFAAWQRSLVDLYCSLMTQQGNRQ
jgi:glycosyltransferase involved in cell wall biosynthesis